jgi:hypothetical protein
VLTRVLDHRQGGGASGGTEDLVHHQIGRQVLVVDAEHLGGPAPALG